MCPVKSSSQKNFISKTFVQVRMVSSDTGGRTDLFQRDANNSGKRESIS